MGSIRPALNLSLKFSGRGFAGKALRFALASRGGVATLAHRMIEENARAGTGDAVPPTRLDGAKVTLVYSMFHHLGDFVVMGGLLKKYDRLGVPFERLVAHANSPYLDSFDGPTDERFYNARLVRQMFTLVRKLRERRRQGWLVLGIPMAPGSLQAFSFFWMLKKLGAVSHIVDFNLGNADILTPPRRRYIFDRHLAQAAELFQRPDWLADTSMPLAIVCPPEAHRSTRRRIGIFPWSGRRTLPEFQWPAPKWLELVRRILDQADGDVVLLGRDGDFVPFELNLRAQLPAEMRARFLGRQARNVPDLAATIRQLDGLVTLNTSALHIAHALKLPTVGLCGSSAEFWLPEGDHIRFVRDTKAALPPSDKYHHDPLQPSVQRLEVDDVHGACVELFKKGRQS